jgi:hypothetical protein
MKLPTTHDLKVKLPKSSSKLIDYYETDKLPIRTDIGRTTTGSEISTTRSIRRSPQPLNFFERPKIPHIMKHKFMMHVEEGSKQDQHWTEYWREIEKKISTI